jgi:flagellar hook-basal body complex protein FliE
MNMPVDKIANPVAAASAYASSAKTARTPGMGKDVPSFGDMLKNSAQSAIQTMRAGEKAQAQAVTGTASLTDVVEAVTSAELTLQSVVAIRDKMIGAYQDIMRMPI